ncbi:uncharacterized protein LOC108207141 [Daucus carota subsp. sativus]|uniref:uncharacterized protein LOC108207141 n=1 Tax=Daucus carota subsp. sativus TaxID=79200 RepID=UPI0007F018C0|nr:PREDICTED: uncharacterized protein LOC108207141 [Daucus carota subsp. sativus]
MIVDFCSYNIRGLHNKISFAKDFLSHNKFGIAALLETHVKKEDAAFYSSIVAPKYKWLFNYDYHNNGRIWVGWDDTIWHVTLIDASAQQITCEVKHVDGGSSCLLSIIYASNDGVLRRHLWTKLTNLHQRYNSSADMPPWCLMGDFNIFLNSFETNGLMPRRQGYIFEFRTCINDLGLVDLRYHGAVFTWWDGNISAPVLRKLDRVLVNDTWLRTFDLSLANFLPRGLSDHNPATVYLGIVRDTIHKPFQLFKHLMDNEQFLSTVQQAWEDPVIGDKWFIVTTKLKRVKLALKNLNTSGGNLHANVLSARNALLNFQGLLPMAPSHAQRTEEGKLSNDLRRALLLEEKFLKQKSRVRWLNLGDGNNKFFYNSCKGRWNANKILNIYDEDGNNFTGHKNIASVAVSYFKN